MAGKTPDNITPARGKRPADRGGPGLDQLALATLIESGRYDRHLRRVRAEYATSREILLSALARHARHRARRRLARRAAPARRHR